jgi:hypothetical protein
MVLLAFLRLGMKQVSGYTLKEKEPADCMDSSDREESAMQCSGCGNPLHDGVSVCLNCGTPVPVHKDEMPLDTILVADLSMETVTGGEDDAWPTLAPPTSPYGRYASVQPPPPPLYLKGTSRDELYDTSYQKTSPWFFRIRGTRASFTLITFFIVLIVSGVGTSVVFANIRSSHNEQTGGSLDGSSISSKCARPLIDPVAMSKLGNVQTTSNVHDIDKRDFTPVDNQNTFVVGSTVMVTFSIMTDEPGTISPTWCVGTDGVQIDQKDLDVQGDSRGTGGYVKLANTSARDVGTGVLVLRWNGVVADVLTFTIKGK